jgi:uncharacterized repeat protein (TIGR03803 family)
MDASGNIYGVTANGGANNTGAVFKITPAGAYSVLHSFGNLPYFGNSASGDGYYSPGSAHTAGLVIDSKGNVYGTTDAGGANNTGTVFKITPAGAYSVLHSFGPMGSGDGRHPEAGLAIDGNGNLYGTTISGGANNGGTVFKIMPTGAYSVLYSFGSSISGDGSSPQSALVMDANGNLYGTTSYGGANGSGTVFKITPAGSESTLYSFAIPRAGLNSLAIDGNGNLYGTTNIGGTNGNGTVFKITPAGAYSVLYSFGPLGSRDGNNPSAGLALDANGNLYGTTFNGGANGTGTVFKITPSLTG